LKALRFHSYGGPAEVLRVEELPLPSPGPGEVLVQVHASSINPSDVKIVEGKTGHPTLPRTPGRDFAGVVVTGDPDLIGQEVWAAGGDIGTTRDGSHAEYIVIPRKGVRPKPKPLSMIDDSGGQRRNQLYQRLLGFIEKAQLKSGETLLVTGATGGVGSSVVKIARLKSARIIGVDSHSLLPDKARAMGIGLALNSDSDDIVNRVKQFTQGEGADVVFDCVGGPIFETVLNSLGAGGRQVNITSVGDRRVCFDLLDLYHRQLTLFGIDTIALDTISCGNILEGLRPGFEDGLLTPPEIARTCSFD
jgi:NADPH:quinone reductase-like Zn-dependent oxidoreductase